MDTISEFIYNQLSPRFKEYNITLTQEQVKEVVENVYKTELTMTYHIKNEYRNKGLYPTTLHNVVLM